MLGVEVLPSQYKVGQQHNGEQQQLYDIVADWWDEVLCCNPAPLDRDGEYLDKNPTIIDLVNAIVEWKNND